MKKYLAITLILLICLCNALSLTLNNDSNAKTELNIEIKSVNHEENKIERSKPNTESSKLADKNTKKSKKFKTRKAKKASRSLIESSQNSTSSLYINAAGQVVDQPMIVSTAPYIINRCDQIIAFKADLISDLNDYTKRTSAYFTMSAYHLNVFDSNDSSTLKRSIILSFGKAPPSEPIGAQYCLLNDGGDDSPMLFCASNQADSDSFKAALATFSDCRAGKIIGGDSSLSSSASTNSTAPATPSMSDLAKKCGFDGPMASPSTLLQQNNNNNAPDPSSEDFWLPGGQKVPGSPAVDPDAPTSSDDDSS